MYELNLEEIPYEWNRVRRKQRAARGEAGKIDTAAAFEQKRNRSFIYVQTPNSGLIELDEAPLYLSTRKQLKQPSGFPRCSTQLPLPTSKS